MSFRFFLRFLPTLSQITFSLELFYAFIGVIFVEEWFFKPFWLIISQWSLFTQKNGSSWRSSIVLLNRSAVVYKLEFDAKNRGRCVHIGHPQKSDFSEKVKSDAKTHLHEKSRWLINFSSTYILNEGYTGLKI